MSPLVEPGPPFPPTAGPALRARRCSRHPTREAIARCPACAGFFCRECVVEHDGQLICASCLARQVANEVSPIRKRPRPVLRAREAVGFALALLLLWILFYGFGSLLLRVPAKVHDGTIWKVQSLEGNESPD